MVFYFMMCHSEVFLAPLTAGSGLPEVKGYLNGNQMPGLFVLKKAPIRVVGIVLVIGAGMPLGREGPMVCIGGSCGLLILTRIVKPYFRKWIAMNVGKDRHISQVDCDELSVVQNEESYKMLEFISFPSFSRLDQINLPLDSGSYRLSFDRDQPALSFSRQKTLFFRARGSASFPRLVLFSYSEEAKKT
jgi:hypothetical protein